MRCSGKTALTPLSPNGYGNRLLNGHNLSPSLSRGAVVHGRLLVIGGTVVGA